MELIFLEADVRLSKSFALKDNAISKTSYPLVSRFTSHIEQIATIRDMHAALVTHANLGHCLLKGRLRTPLKDQSRAGATNALDSTEYLAFDIEAHAGIKSPAQFLTLLCNVASWFSDVDHVIQYSASHGIGQSEGISAHIYFMLAKPALPAEIKQWLMYLNFTIPQFADRLALSRTGCALRWPLDITTCQNDKLLYIAPPELGKGVRCKFKEPRGSGRIQFIKGKHRTVAVNFTLANATQNRELTTEHINRMRMAIGMPARKLNLRISNTHEILAKPGPAVLTGHKTERGFTYLNLNGGDSWGYWHPTENPELIHNFKGEPSYLTRELLPDYYVDVIKNSRPSGIVEDSAAGITWLAFLDPRSDTYYRGRWDQKTDELILNSTGQHKRIIDFLAQHGQAVGDFVPEWTYEFRFDENALVDEASRFVNRYQRTLLMHEHKETVKSHHVPACPPTILWLLRHVCGDDNEAVERMLNWIAVVYQHRCATGTMWVLSGTEGTGKGVLFNQVLAPIFGHRYCVTKSIDDLEDSFNGYMEECVFLLVDEAKVEYSRRYEKVMARLRNMSVEPTISIRRMHTNHYMARNWMNIIIASNHRDPVKITSGDRRHNVAPYQANKITMTPELMRKIHDEVPRLASYLAQHTADRELARTPLRGSAHAELVELSRSSADTVADALLKGDTQFLLDQLPNDGDPRPSSADVVVLAGYKRLVERVCAGGSMVLSREEVQCVFEWCVGGVPGSPNKFTSFVKHHGILFKRCRRGDGLVQGVEVRMTPVKTATKPVMEKVVPIRRRK